MPDLRIRDVSKTYPNGVHALQRINLTIPSGMYGLLGPNGAGKSTLMRTIATLQEADEGEIQLGSLDVVRQKDELRKTLGYLPQQFGVYPKTTAERLLNHLPSSAGSRGEGSGGMRSSRFSVRRISGTCASSTSGA